MPQVTYGKRGTMMRQIITHLRHQMPQATACHYHLNTNINTKEIQTKKSSNEDLVLSNISIKEGFTTIKKESSDNPSLAEVKAIVAADDIWAVFESR